MGRDSVVSIATRYELDSPGIEFHWYDRQKYSLTILAFVQYPRENINCEAHVKSVDESGIRQSTHILRVQPQMLKNLAINVLLLQYKLNQITVVFLLLQKSVH